MLSPAQPAPPAPPSSAIPALVCGLTSGLPELPRGLELRHCSRAVMGGRGPGGPEASGGGSSMQLPHTQVSHWRGRPWGRDLCVDFLWNLLKQRQAHTWK